MPDPSTETQIALLIAGQKSLLEQVEDIENRSDKKIAIVEGELAALRLERDKALRWGLVSLGTAVAAMATYIFNHSPWGKS